MRKRKNSRTPSVRPKRPERTPIWRGKSTNKEAQRAEIDVAHESLVNAMATIQQKEDVIKEAECVVDGMITDIILMGHQNTSPQMMSTLRKDLLRDSSFVPNPLLTLLIRCSRANIQTNR